MLSAAPLAAAIGVFGIVFGAVASGQMDVALVIATSLLVFSGTLQFTTVGLVGSGAGPVAILLTALALNTRHLVLGAVIRPHVEGSPVRRAAWHGFCSTRASALRLRRSGERASYSSAIG